VQYYCEFCEINLCVNCTVEEAHEENYMETVNVHKCKQIHRSGDDEHDDKPINSNIDIEEMDTEDVVVGIDKANEIQNCQCGRSRQQGNLECKELKKLFCENCPSRPIELNCIECMSLSSIRKI
jgi:hypothetical protein